MFAKYLLFCHSSLGEVLFYGQSWDMPLCMVLGMYAYACKTEFVRSLLTNWTCRIQNTVKILTLRTRCAVLRQVPKMNLGWAQACCSRMSVQSHFFRQANENLRREPRIRIYHQSDCECKYACPVRDSIIFKRCESFTWRRFVWPSVNWCWWNRLLTLKSQVHTRNC